MQCFAIISELDRMIYWHLSQTMWLDVSGSSVFSQKDEHLSVPFGPKAISGQLQVEAPLDIRWIPSPWHHCSCDLIDFADINARDLRDMLPLRDGDQTVMDKIRFWTEKSIKNRMENIGLIWISNSFFHFQGKRESRIAYSEAADQPLRVQIKLTGNGTISEGFSPSLSCDELSLNCEINAFRTKSRR
jgi:hypothetical protein